ncbi:hypothetical protein ACFQX4_19220 [Roseomonas sp. GCM10028921]
MAEVIPLHSEYYRGYKIAVRPCDTQPWNICIRRWDPQGEGDRRVVHGQSSQAELISHGRNIIDSWTDARMRQILNR